MVAFIRTIPALFTKLQQPGSTLIKEACQAVVHVIKLYLFLLIYKGQIREIGADNAKATKFGMITIFNRV